MSRQILVTRAYWCLSDFRFLCLAVTGKVVLTPNSNTRENNQLPMLKYLVLPLFLDESLLRTEQAQLLA